MNMDEVFVGLATQRSGKAKATRHASDVIALSRVLSVSSNGAKKAENTKTEYEVHTDQPTNCALRSTPRWATFHFSSTDTLVNGNCLLCIIVIGCLGFEKVQL